MKKFLPILLLISSCSTQSDKTKSNQIDTTKVVENFKPKVISDSTNTLTGKIENLELEYIVWGCACANWVTIADRKKYEDSGLAAHCIFIEPADKSLELPLYFSPFRHRLKVKGQFYVRPDYPQGTVQGEEQLDKAKVFRYTKIEVTNQDIKYLPKDDTTLNLSYNAIACTCAQWSDTKSIADTAQREYFYLEPASGKLINADKLYNGNNLPIQIQVTGQIVSYSGYPTGFNPAKGDPKAEIVFRYTKIKVLKNGQTKNGY
jgi:hypothetical protein